MTLSRTLAVVCSVMGIGVLTAAGQGQATIAVLPDTQFYSDSATRFPAFRAQTTWIRDNIAREKIAFVSHLGDIVQNGSNGGNDIEWQRADEAMDILNGFIDYSASIGNHDFNIVSIKSSGSSSYNTWFGPARYASMPGYQGSSADGENHAHTFSAGGYDFLHLSLEWQPDAAAIAWAQSTINANPGKPVVIVTHEYLQDWDSTGLGAGRSSSGTALWNGLIRVNPSIFLVMNGHFHRGPDGADGELHTVSTNDAGLPVLEMLSDFQAYPNGGDGWMRLVTLDFGSNVVRVRTFSPSLNQFQQDFNSQFDIPMDFQRRFRGAPGNAVPTVAFREGVAGYVSTADVQLSGATPSTQAGAAASISVDGSDAGFPTHGLIRFDNAFGPGPGQADPARDVIAATLRLDTFNEGSGYAVHRMVRGWSETDTWNSLTGGVAADGIDAVAYPDVTLGRNTTSANVGRIVTEIDVTRSVRAWLNGQPNLGWALLPTAAGTNGVDFHSSEAATTALRPQLVLTTADRPTIAVTLAQDVGGYTQARDIELDQGNPNFNIAFGQTLRVGGDSPSGSGNDRQALLRFNNAFINIPGRIPSGGAVTSAVLVLNVLEEGSGFSLHTMRLNWPESASWNSLNAGIAADNAEAAIFIEAGAGANATTPTVRTGPLYLDVTDTVRDWYFEPFRNNGWVLRPFPSGSNELVLASSDHPDPALRPTLIVRLACPAELDGLPGVDLGDFFAYLNAFDATDPAADINRDGTVDLADFFDFLNRFEIGC